MSMSFLQGSRIHVTTAQPEARTALAVGGDPPSAGDAQG
jgi:hypothetical protein